MSGELGAETLRPCRAKTIAYLGFGGDGQLIPCGLLAGHEGPHRYHVEWWGEDPEPYMSLRDRMERAMRPRRRGTEREW